ncbi:hypothetical protein ADEAN_000234000 [Angomonas deanei]|uniref:Uncharacterized protein n=1 Tax=Angomonas deanei TaxID=59799 RepID=A0A7G2C7U9_9TRYP|nr:hypothetical protein ADEAN_000234000 [Angomonas deanei]
MVDKVALDVFCVSVVEGEVSGPPLCRHEASPPCITVHRDTILTRREKLELIYAMCRDRFQRAASLVLESTEKVSDSVECPNSVASTTALDHSTHTIDEETNEEVVEAATPHSQSLQKTVTRSHLSQRTVCPKSSASKNVEYSSSALRFSSGSGKERPHTMESTYSETYDGFLIDALVELEKNAHDIGEQVHMALDKERKEAEPDLSGLIGEESEVKLERRSQKRKSQSKKPSPTKERRSLKKSPRAASRHTATMKSARPDHAGRVRDSLVNFSDVLFDSPTDWLNNIVLPSAQQANEESQEVFFQH